MSARDWYRMGLLASVPLIVVEIATVHAERAARADDLEAVDCTDVLEAHGVAVQ